MAAKQLIAPTNINIVFEPSARQYELWKCLQPECADCGGQIENVFNGIDERGNRQFVPKCKSCGTTNIPQMILGGGAAGGGKSYVGSIWLCSSCIRFPNARMALVRRQLKDIKNSTLVTIKTVLKEWGLKEDINYSINNVTNIISFWNGSEILMMELADLPSDVDFSRIGSLELTGVMVEEATEISERAADTIFSRIRWKLSETFKVPKMFMGCNPAPCWLRSRFVQDDEGNPVTCRPNERFVRFSVWDNPNEQFRQTYESALNKIKDEATKQRLLYGNWDFSAPNDMAIYNKFSGDKHLITGLMEKYHDPLKPIVISIDFNVAPFMSALVAQIDYSKKRIYCFNELLGTPDKKENNTPAFARKIRDYILEIKNIGGITITGDPSGRQRSTASESGVNNYTIITDEIGKKFLNPSVRLLPKQPPQKTRCEFINDILGKDKNDDGWTIWIDPRCRKLTEDLIYQTKEDDGSKSKKKVTDPKNGVRYEKYGHLSDCFDYLVCYFLRNEYKNYISGSLDTSNIITTQTAQYNTGFNY